MEDQSSGSSGGGIFGTNAVGYTAIDIVTGASAFLSIRDKLWITFSGVVSLLWGSTAHPSIAYHNRPSRQFLTESILQQTLCLKGSGASIRLGLLRGLYNARNRLGVFLYFGREVLQYII
jgi:hypothetical protein